MSVIAFLAGIADPETAAAAASSSADVLKAKLREKIGPKADATEVNGKGKAKETDSMEVDGAQNNEVATDRKISTEEIANVPLAMMGSRAGGLVSQEEREMTRLVSSVLNVTLEKVELKMRYFNEMEAMLQAERRELERARQQLFLERLTFKRRVRELTSALARVSIDRPAPVATPQTTQVGDMGEEEL